MVQLLGCHTVQVGRIVGYLHLCFKDRSPVDYCEVHLKRCCADLLLCGCVPWAAAVLLAAWPASAEAGTVLRVLYCYCLAWAGWPCGQGVDPA